VRRIEDISDRTASTEFRLRVDLRRVKEDALEQLEELFSKAAGPSTVIFEVEGKDGTTAVVQSQRKIRVTPDFIAALERICGDEGIQRIS